MPSITHSIELTSLLALVLAAFAPVSLIALVFIPSKRANANGQGFAKTVSLLAASGFLTTVGAAILFWLSKGPPPAGMFFPYLDALSITMLLLVSFLLAIVTRYSIHYLAGDPSQGRFAKWLGVTGGSVLTLILSGDLLVFTLAWMATSLSLHQLLTFYADRPAARLAAKKKFLFSRLGDLCIVGVLILVWQSFGTWRFDEIFNQAEAMWATGAATASINWISILLVTGAMLKSAQFPFHTWLPDTMETPTPVSALMHAGIINAGGFLIVRFSPLVALSPAALNALAAVGAFTALIASLVMLTQTSVKRSLAYSTIAQMGFMMLQCGLGAFALAVLHIVAHSLYKAYAFLSSGSIVEIRKAAWVPTERPAAHPVALIGTLLAAIVLTSAIGLAFGVSPQSHAGAWLLGIVFVMAVSYLLWNLWASSQRVGSVSIGLALTTAAALCYFTLHKGAEKLLASSVVSYAPERALWEYAVMLVIALCFLAVLVFQAQLPVWSSSTIAKKLYVRAASGFHLGGRINRLIKQSEKLFNHRAKNHPVTPIVSGQNLDQA